MWQNPTVVKTLCSEALKPKQSIRICLPVHLCPFSRRGTGAETKTLLADLMKLGLIILAYKIVLMRKIKSKKEEGANTNDFSRKDCVSIWLCRLSITQKTLWKLGVQYWNKENFSDMNNKMGRKSLKNAKKSRKSSVLGNQLLHLISNSGNDVSS